MDRPRRRTCGRRPGSSPRSGSSPPPGPRRAGRPRRPAGRGGRRGRARSTRPRWPLRAPRASASRGWRSRLYLPPEPCRTCGRVGYRCASPPPAGGPRGALRRAYRIVAGPRRASLRALRWVRLLLCAGGGAARPDGRRAGHRLPAVKRITPAPAPRAGAVFVLAGGPGQSATAAFAGDGVGLLYPAYRSRDVIVFDQRGTGRSGPLRCRALEQANLLSAEEAAGAAPPACSRGAPSTPRRTRWRTWRPSAASWESTGSRSTAPRTGRRWPWPTPAAIRPTWSAWRWTRWWRPAAPTRSTATRIAAVPRALRAVCRERAPSFTRDPVGDLQSLVGQMRARAAAGSAGGRPRAGPAPGPSAATTCSASSSRGTSIPPCEQPSRARCARALRGDAAPLLRLSRRTFTVDGEPPPPRHPERRSVRGHVL